METPIHTMTALFEQLGLDGSENAIEQFIAEHSPLSDSIPLAEASFWSDSQSAFLKDMIAKDADWAEVVDQLDASLR